MFGILLENKDLNFHLGNAIKYICRAGYKDSKIQDLEKAIHYLENELHHEKDIYFRSKPRNSVRSTTKELPSRSSQRDRIRRNLIVEEFKEFLEADAQLFRDGNCKEEALKELADLVYVCYQYAENMGWLLDEARTEFMKVICPNSVRTVNQYTEKMERFLKDQITNHLIYLIYFNDCKLNIPHWSGPVMVG